MRREGNWSTVGADIRRHRQHAGWTQRQLAERAGVGVRTIRELEHGRTKPQETSLRRIADALGIDLSPPGTEAVRVDILGPLRLRTPLAVEISTPLPATLLGLLALHAGEVVSMNDIVDVLWGTDPPRSCVRLVHGYAARLRPLLGPDGLAKAATGYRLAVPTDAAEFRRLTADARRVDQPAALLEAALGLWRGRVLSGAPHRLRQHPSAVALGRQRIEAALAYADAGEPAAAVDLLRALMHDEPLHEAIAARLVQALAAGGEQAAALDVYTAVRTRLADELGIEPGPDLRRAHLEVLQGKPSDERTTGPRQLPAATRLFVGRTTEMGLLAAADPRHPTVGVIDGAAGTGKTALAVRVAHRVAADYPDGQLFVDLCGFTPNARPVSAAVALDRVLRALGVPGREIPEGLDDRAALWRSTVAGKRVLLVLDNAAADSQVLPLLPGTAGCRVLVTSRRRLTALDDAVTVTLDVMSTADGADLFARVATRNGPSPVVAEIVELCGRLPLAIVIAAARLRARPHWKPQDLADRLRDHDRRLAELHVGGRSVTAALDLSYRQLPADQRRMFRLAGVHPGPHFDVYAAAAMAGLDPRYAEELLDALADVHLVEQPTAGRYQCHDLVLGYAAGLTSTEDRAALPALLSYYLYGAWVAAETLYPPDALRRPRIAPPGFAMPRLTDPGRAGAWLDAERATLVASAGAAVDAGHLDHTIQLSQILERHYEVRSLYGDAEVVQGLALDAAIRTGDVAGEARALHDLAMVHHRRGRHEVACDLLQRAQRIWAGLDDPPSPSPGSALGVVYSRLGRWDEAAGLLSEALDFYRRRGDHAGLSSTLINLGILHAQTGRWPQAEALFTEALRYARRTGNRTAEGHTLTNLSIVAAESGRYAEAVARLEEAIAVHRENHDGTGEMHAVANLGLIHDRLGQYEQALVHHRRALDLYRAAGHHGEVESLNDMGRTLTALGRLDESAARLAEALRLAERTGDRFQLARAHEGLGHVAQVRGDLAQARWHWEQALGIFADLKLREADQVRADLAALLPAGPAAGQLG